MADGPHVAKIDPAVEQLPSLWLGPR